MYMHLFFKNQKQRLGFTVGLLTFMQDIRILQKITTFINIVFFPFICGIAY